MKKNLLILIFRKAFPFSPSQGISNHIQSKVNLKMFYPSTYLDIYLSNFLTMNVLIDMTG